MTCPDCEIAFASLGKASLFTEYIFWCPSCGLLRFQRVEKGTSATDCVVNEDRRPQARQKQEAANMSHTPLVQHE